MELSHWDLRKDLSLLEASCLAAGIDPGMHPSLDDERRARVRFLCNELTGAYRRAFVHARDTCPQPPSWRAADLPSQELKMYCVGPECELPMDWEDSNFGLKPSDQSFDRGTLAAWFAQSGFTPNYRFVRVDCTPERLDQDTPIGKKERETFLIIIAALLKHAEVDWNRPDKAARVIQRMAEELGLKIGDSTIEEKLKLIPAAIKNPKRRSEAAALIVN